MILEGKNVLLVPVDNLDYTILLVSSYFNVNKELATDYITKHAKEFWTVLFKGQVVGIIGYYEVDGEYVLESIKDRNAPRLGMVGALETGNLVIDYLNQPIKTSVKLEEKAIQSLALKLGFKELSRTNKFVLYKKEMKTWVG